MYTHDIYYTRIMAIIATEWPATATSSHGRCPPGKGKGTKKKIDPSRTIWVGNIPAETKFQDWFSVRDVLYKYICINIYIYIYDFQK